MVGVLATTFLFSVAPVGAADIGQPCNPSWYLAKPPNPEWGLPPTLGDILPAHFYDTEIVQAVFLVPLEKLQSLLPAGVMALAADAERSPWNAFGPNVAGFGIFGVFFAEHSWNEYLPPYNEAFLTVMIDDAWWDKGFSMWYVVSVTVTREAAQWAGIEGWGYPKVLGGTHLQSVGKKGMKCFASTDGELIVKLEVRTEDMGLAAFSPTSMLVNIKDGYLVRCPFLTTGIQYGSFSIGTSTITLGEVHPVAQKLRAIGLGTYPSIGQIWGINLQQIGYAGVCTPLAP